MEAHGHLYRFHEHFVVAPAESPKLVQQAYWLRYQVYCIENAFEDARLHRNGMETDEYDDYSRHAVLIHRLTGTVCGCVRLILPSSFGRDLPMMRLIDPAAREQLSGISRSRIAEVSRYAISKAFRRRAGENPYPDVSFVELPGNQRRLLPEMTLGLMLCVAKLSVRHGIDHLCAVMTPGLLRLLRQFGMEFHSVGPLTVHHGLRQPCIAGVQELLDGVRVHRPEYFALVNAEFESGVSVDGPDWKNQPILPHPAFPPSSYLERRL
jgi:N-acyl amino acid synthase of PEP-CTERM/exosortase system